MLQLIQTRNYKTFIVAFYHIWAENTAVVYSYSHTACMGWLDIIIERSQVQFLSVSGQVVHACDFNAKQYNLALLKHW